jgi:hypothetical protein
MRVYRAVAKNGMRDRKYNEEAGKEVGNWYR